MDRPEHTLGGYRLAMDQGADFIEPDLRMTKDGVFIALHDHSLDRTTDIATKPEFADRARRDANNSPFWVPGDFTLAEIKTLRTKQGVASRAKVFDGLEQIPSLQEIVDLIRAYRKETGRVVGMVPELRGNAPEFVRFVQEFGLEDKDRGIPLYVQSFALADLKQVRPHLRAPAAWLVTNWPDPKDWPALKDHIDAFAVGKSLVNAADGKDRIAAAHRAGFKIVAWTFSDDSRNPANHPLPREELEQALGNGVDAFFTDSPASGVHARNAASLTTSRLPP